MIRENDRPFREEIKTDIDNVHDYFWHNRNLIVGIVHTGIAYVLYFGSMKALKAQTVALFSYIDPIVAIILSAFILHERMGIAEMAGAVLILCATMISEKEKR